MSEYDNTIVRAIDNGGTTRYMLIDYEERIIFLADDEDDHLVNRKFDEGDRFTVERLLDTMSEITILFKSTEFRAVCESAHKLLSKAGTT